MTTQEIITEHTKRVTLAVQSFERERAAIILEHALAEIASTQKPDGTDMVARAKYQAEGAQAEQERIIKLIEDLYKFELPPVANLIATIKSKEK